MAMPLIMSMPIISALYTSITYGSHADHPTTDMQLPTNVTFKSIRNVLLPIKGSPSMNALFALDTLSLILFAMVILGIVSRLPVLSNVITQSLFVASTLILTIQFARKRHIGMMILKLSMLSIVYYIDSIAYLQ